MRVLVVIPHFYSGASPNGTNQSRNPQARNERVQALTSTITSLQQTFGQSVYGLDHWARCARQARSTIPHEVEIIVCTNGDNHLLDAIQSLRPLIRHHIVDGDPTMLGFECHRLLASNLGRYDYYCYLEDDISILDPLFFRKRKQFDSIFDNEVLLQPNRFELKSGGVVNKLYVDFRLSPKVTANMQVIDRHDTLQMGFFDGEITFERTTYPSAGCFILNEAQLSRWMHSDCFLDLDVSYMSALDSAATLSVMKTFKIYKSQLGSAWFFEVQHSSPRWIQAAERITHLVPGDFSLPPIM
jgi:hypothetical protein